MGTIVMSAWGSSFGPCSEGSIIAVYDIGEIIMRPALFNLEIIRGATFSLPMSWSDINGVVDIESRYVGARMQIRPSMLGVPKAEPDEPVLLLDTNNGGIIISGSVLTIYISASITAAFSISHGWYDLELFSGTLLNEVVDKIIYGEVIISKEVTI